MLFYRFI